MAIVLRNSRPKITGASGYGYNYSSALRDIPVCHRHTSIPACVSLSADFSTRATNQVSAHRATFPTTQWSLVLSVRVGAEEAARSALELLCRQYWYPIYYFVRRQGRTHHEAEDLTQQFLAHLLETEAIGTAHHERGRFRSFLLSTLRNFITDEWRRSQTIKRGGGQPARSIELDRAEQRFAAEPVDLGLTPDQAFDRAWAVEILDRAMDQLREEYASTGRSAVFTALSPGLLKSSARDATSRSSYPPEMNAHAVSMALNRLRFRLGLRLRDEIAATVADGVNIDSELRLLIAALSSG